MTCGFTEHLNRASMRASTGSRVETTGRKESETMARQRGRGIASVNYPIGMNLGGDPSQALVHSNPGGKFTVSLS